jgi:hypothetical protein
MYQEWVKVNFTTQRNASLLNISSRSKCVYVIAGIVLWCRKQGSPDPIELCSVAHNLMSSSPYMDLWSISHFGVESTQRTTCITGSKSILIYLFIANKKHNKLKLLFCKAGVREMKQIIKSCIPTFSIMFRSLLTQLVAYEHHY